jgi:hypothetical protein
MENAGIFCGHFTYFNSIWYILLSFGTFVVQPCFAPT